MGSRLVPYIGNKPKATPKLLAQLKKAGRSLDDVKYTALAIEEQAGKDASPIILELQAAVEAKVMEAGQKLQDKYPGTFILDAVAPITDAKGVVSYPAIERLLGIAFQTEAYLATLSLPEVTEEEIAPFRNMEKAEKVAAVTDSI